MSSKNILFLVVAILIALVLGGLFLIQRGAIHLPSPQEGKSAPGFSLRDFNGKEVKLSDFSGKPLVVNSWAAWCPFCVKELPDFAAIQKEFGDKVVIVAIDRAESLTTAKKFTDNLGVSGNLVLLLDPNDSFYQSIGGFSMPETIFVSKDGRTVFHKRGPMSQDEMRQRIKEII